MIIEGKILLEKMNEVSIVSVNTGARLPKTYASELESRNKI
jgi:hypothetical protein